MGPSQPTRATGSAFLLAIPCAAIYAVRLSAAGFYDNEGRFAELARQMLVRGEYVTPCLNGIPFLNKPPLTAWLAAALFPLFAEPEWARLVSVAASAVSVMATALLGARTYGAAHGLLAGLLLATTAGFVLETRTLRPDGLLVASLTVALLCLWHASMVPAGGHAGSSASIWPSP